uniref:DAN domain-containing protein n=1 Tax=Heterorhabditis bacteriophora TaxID=37862 RepID=A0A1I7XNJ9_HETBA
MSVADGYIHYSVGNETYLKDLSRQAFQMLNSGIEPQILLHPNKALPADKPKKKHRKPGRRKPPLDGRTHALLSLNDPNGLKKEQHCEGEKFKQRVKSPGCLTKVIVNRFCHGTCSSYFIPRLNAKKLKAVFKSCAACAPKDYDTVDVTLDCPGQNPPQVIKTIIKVMREKLYYGAVRSAPFTCTDCSITILAQSIYILCFDGFVPIIVNKFEKMSTDEMNLFTWATS